MANKKITQLASKSSVLSTDLFPIGDASTGTLYKKTIAELQAAIGGAVISVNGKVGTVVLNTDDVSEATSPTNLYFTNTRARGAISLTTTGSSGASTYSSSTGILNVPTYTLAGLGGITATFLSGTSGVSYNSSTGVISFTGTVYTDSSIKALLSASAPLSFNSTTGAFSISQATTSTNGYLSSTDWNTFNGKQSALTNPITGTSTSGYVAFFNGSTTLSGDSGLFWDNTNKRLGIGTTSPSYPLHIYSTTAARNLIEGTTNFAVHQVNNTGGSLFIGIDDSAGANFTGTAYGRFIYSTGAYPLTFVTNNTERIRITSGGNVGIGTTSPSSILELSQPQYTFLTLTGTNTTQVQMNLGVNQVTQATYISSVTNHPLILQTNSTERMRITSGGEVCINTTSTINSDKLMVQMANSTNQTGLGVRAINDGGTASQPAISFYNGSGVLLSRMYADNGTGYFAINTTSSNTERLRIVNSSGNLLLGTSTDNGERLYVSGAIRATGTITANSDITLKKNLAKIENALEKVEQINGYTYEFKADDSKRHAGVIAQEIEGVLPEIVNKGNDGLLGVEYGNISALLIEAIKEQQAQINKLKALLNK